MKRLLLATATTALLTPAMALAAEQRPSEQMMMYATQTRADATDAIAQLRTDLRQVRQVRSSQEIEFAKLFSALTAVREQLAEERANLEAQTFDLELAENALLAQTLTVEGAPSNVLKVRALQRKLANAKKLFDQARADEFAALEEKEADLNRQWNTLETSREQFRMVMNQKEQDLIDQIDAYTFDVSYTDATRLTGRNELHVRDERSSLQELRRQRYYERMAERNAAVREALREAREDNYLTEVQPEVAEELARQQAEEQEQARAMQLKYFLDSLGTTGPLTEDTAAALDLILFGIDPTEEVVPPVETPTESTTENTPEQ